MIFLLIYIVSKIKLKKMATVLTHGNKYSIDCPPDYLISSIIELPNSLCLHKLIKRNPVLCSWFSQNFNHIKSFLSKNCQHKSCIKVPECETVRYLCVSVCPCLIDKELRFTKKRYNFLFIIDLNIKI